MKTTLDLPDALLESAENVAAQQGRSLDALVEDALREKLARELEDQEEEVPEWRKLYGAFGKTPEDREETRRIQAVIDEEFGQIDPLER